MVEFFEAHGLDLIALITALGGLIGTIAGLVRIFKTDKSVGDKIKITREGVVEAFKTAKIPTEWKIDVSRKIDASLTKWREELVGLIKKDLALNTELLLFALKILSYTAASNKLTPEDKAKLDELMRLVGDEDKTLDISE